MLQHFVCNRRKHKGLKTTRRRRRTILRLRSKTLRLKAALQLVPRALLPFSATTRFLRACRSPMMVQGAPCMIRGLTSRILQSCAQVSLCSAGAHGTPAALGRHLCPAPKLSEVPTSSFPPKKSPAKVFSFNFLAIIPLAWLIGKATEASLEDFWGVSASALSL